MQAAISSAQPGGEGQRRYLLATWIASYRKSAQHMPKSQDKRTTAQLEASYLSQFPPAARSQIEATMARMQANLPEDDREWYDRQWLVTALAQMHKSR